MSNAYNYQPQAAPPQKSGGALKVILIVLGVLMILCCGGVGVTTYVIYAGAKAVMVEIAKQAISETPEAQTALGEIQSVSIDTSTGVATITGSSGTGTVKLPEEGGAAELKMSDGKTIPLNVPDTHQPDVKMPDLNSTQTESESTKEAEAPAPAP